MALELFVRSGIAILLLACLPLLGACDRQSPPVEQGNGATADEVASSPDEVATSAPATGTKAGEKTGTIDRSHRGEAAPDVAFQDPKGVPVTLAAFRGKPLLVNLWATWCTPCVAEMPTLDALAAREGDALTVLTVSQDMDGAAKVTPFFAAKGYRTLRPYLDPKLGLSLAYSANLPTTILYDPDGRELWRMAGGMDWTGAAARALIDEAR